MRRCQLRACGFRSLGYDTTNASNYTQTHNHIEYCIIWWRVFEWCWLRDIHSFICPFIGDIGHHLLAANTVLCAREHSNARPHSKGDTENAFRFIECNGETIVYRLSNKRAIFITVQYLAETKNEKQFNRIASTKTIASYVFHIISNRRHTPKARSNVHSKHEERKKKNRKQEAKRSKLCNRIVDVAVRWKRKRATKQSKRITLRAQYVF